MTAIDRVSKIAFVDQNLGTVLLIYLIYLIVGTLQECPQMLRKIKFNTEPLNSKHPWT